MDIMKSQGNMKWINMPHHHVTCYIYIIILFLFFGGHGL
jgi:hypothetical protein